MQNADRGGSMTRRKKLLQGRGSYGRLLRANISSKADAKEDEAALTALKLYQGDPSDPSGWPVVAKYVLLRPPGIGVINLTTGQLAEFRTAYHKAKKKGANT